MRDEHFSTIPEKESDEFIKSSVENLVPIPSESKDTFGSNSDCDLPSDDESLSDKDVLEDNVKIYSNPLFEFDDEYISSAVNPLFNEVLENIESKDSYISNLVEPALLVTPLSDANEDKCFDPGGEINEIDAFLDMDISTDIENGYHNSEGDIIYLESLLINDTIPNLPPEVFLDHDPRSLKDEPDKDDLKRFLKIMKTRAYFQSSNRPVFDLLLILESSILITSLRLGSQSIESIRRNFFNGIRDGEKKIAWVCWSKVLASKSNGGLGVSSFYALNRGLLFSGFGLSVRDLCVCGQVIHALHGSNQVLFLPPILRCGVLLLKECNALNLKVCSVAAKMSAPFVSSLRRDVRGGEESAQLSRIYDLLDTVVALTICSCLNLMFSLDGVQAVSPQVYVLAGKISIGSSSFWVKFASAWSSVSYFLSCLL
ncbi:hypothetical protein Tco_0548185 [Tanacetum coccineum]